MAIDTSVREAAVEAIKSKLRELLNEREGIASQREALDVLSRRNDRAIMDCRAAARLFEYDLEIPDDLALQRAILHRRMVSAPVAAPIPHAAPPGAARFLSTETVVPRRSAPVAPPARAPEALAVREPQFQIDAGPEPSVREIILEQLKRVAPEGSKAAPLRATVERILKKKLHDKTVGMTLYRLSKDELVAREGQVWFYRNNNAQTTNPGAATPGPEVEKG